MRHRQFGSGADSRARKRERVRCSPLVDWPVCPCLRRTMTPSNGRATKGGGRSKAAGLLAEPRTAAPVPHSRVPSGPPCSAPCHSADVLEIPSRRAQAGHWPAFRPRGGKAGAARNCFANGGKANWCSRTSVLKDHHLGVTLEHKGEESSAFSTERWCSWQGIGRSPAR